MSKSPIKAARWQRIRVIVYPPAYTTHPTYLAATEWLSGFQPVDDVAGYDKALQYAWRRFDQVSSASDTLDKKADNLMRNAGLIAGLLGIAVNTLKIGHPGFLLPSLVLFIFSLIFAAIACNPTGGASSASIHDVLDDMANGHSSDGWLAASLHCAVEGRTCLNNWKAERLRWATWLFVGGLFSFLLPILAFYVTGL